MLEYFAGLSPVILAVVILLAGFSLASWTIMVLKFLQSRSVGRGMDRFEAFFWEARELDAVLAELGAFKGCPLAALFEAAYGPRQEGGLRGAAALSGRLRRKGEQEAASLSRNLSFLATVGSTAPFIGLFGTVWGIMRAFEGIGRTGSTSLDIVAPGISEALITTAMGLAVAIPAVIGYNFLQRRIRGLAERIDSFAHDLGAILGGDPSRGD